MLLLKSYSEFILSSKIMNNRKNNQQQVTYIAYKLANTTPSVP